MRRSWLEGKCLEGVYHTAVQGTILTFFWRDQGKRWKPDDRMDSTLLSLEFDAS